MCNHIWVTPVTDKGETVWSDVEMYGPLVPCQVIPRPGTGGELIAGQPEILAPGRLQVVPDGAPIGAEELVARDLHVHGAFVNLRQSGSIGADCPDAIHPVPGTLVAKQNQSRVSGRELYVVEPVSGAEDDLALPGSQIDGKQLHGNMRLETLIEPYFPRIRIHQRLAVRTDTWRVSRGERHITLGGSAGQQRFIRVDRSNAAAL